MDAHWLRFPHDVRPASHNKRLIQTIAEFQDQVDLARGLARLVALTGNDTAIVEHLEICAPCRRGIPQGREAAVTSICATDCSTVSYACPGPRPRRQPGARITRAKLPAMGQKKLGGSSMEAEAEDRSKSAKSGVDPGRRRPRHHGLRHDRADDRRLPARRRQPACGLPRWARHPANLFYRKYAKIMRVPNAEDDSSPQPADCRKTDFRLR